MNRRRITDTTSVCTAEHPQVPAMEREILGEAELRQTVVRERHRTDRSGQPFLLILLDLGKPGPDMQEEVVTAFSSFVRETDIVGWYSEGTVLGIIFTELPAEGQGMILGIMLARVTEILRRTLTLRRASHIAISCYTYPESPGFEGQDRRRAAALYPDIYSREQSDRVQRLIKRGMDVVGSCAALVLFSPLFAFAALLVKLSSEGPVIYRQQRLGQFGRTFDLLKFRSMRVDNDPAIHRKFMKSVISGAHNGESSGGERPVYKMTSDPRITPVGRFLRRFSLDELPQFVNVLKGEMSLVGPRPPLAYEFEEYQLWHRRRVLEAQPGITGLWQVRGRSRVRFDDMVRLDLQYVRTWSLWLDLRILCKTPAAVLLGDDAF